MQPDDVPPDVPRSPTGRVPQWVLDEAAGAPVQDSAWRAPTTSVLGTPLGASRRRRRRPSRGLMWFLALVAVAAGLTWWERQAPPSPAPAAQGDQVAWPPPGIGETGRATTPPPAPRGPRASSFAFLEQQPDGSGPVAWSPCRPIQYVMRTAGAPRGGAALVREAVAAVTAATGLVFIEEGVTQEGPAQERPPVRRDLYGDRWAPVLVAWATPAEYATLDGDTAGFAQSQAVDTPSGDSTFVTGQVVIDRADLAGVPRAEVRAVLMHELGHLVGLDHVEDPSQLMNPSSGLSSPTRFQAGDLAGLSALGRGACQPDA